MTASAGKRPGVLIIVQNLPVPFDARVWQESRTLQAAGYDVTVICPKGKGYEAAHEVIDGIRIYRHDLPIEANRPAEFLLEYGIALFHEMRLAWYVLFKHGFSMIHACNPPDLIFLVALPFKLLGKKFLFDHHDITPEFYESKFRRKDFFYRLLRVFERLTYMSADVSIATNESYRRIAIERDHMPPDRVFVVRSGPNLDRLRLLPPVPELRHGRRYLVGYLGVIGNSEGVDGLLECIRIIVRDRGRQDIHFGIVGGGPELETLKRLSKDLGIDEYVTFTGRVSDEDLLRWINTADVCVNADAFNDMNNLSTMNKIVEYMALAKPIVQFDFKEGPRVRGRGLPLCPQQRLVRLRRQGDLAAGGSRAPGKDGSSRPQARRGRSVVAARGAQTPCRLRSGAAAAQAVVWRGSRKGRRTCLNRLPSHRPRPISTTHSGTWSDCYTHHPHFRSRLQTLRAWLADKPKDLLVLDYGCGSGVASLELAARGERVLGVDISEGMIQTSRDALTRAGVSADRFRFERIGTDGAGPYLGETFDGIVSLGVLEYTDDPKAILRLILARLEPGGFLLMSGPNRRSPLRWLERFVFRHPTIFRPLPGFKRMTSPDNYVQFQKHQFQAAELQEFLATCDMRLQRIVYHGGSSMFGPLERTSWFGMTLIAEFRKDTRTP